MASISLTTGETCLLDEDDVHLLDGRRWFAHRIHRIYLYACSGSTRTGAIYLHRLIAGAAAGQSVDHINGNTLDNSRANLRVCTHTQNMRNRRKSVTSASPFKGVIQEGARWRARIGSAKKGAPTPRQSLGIFETAEAAGRAYDMAAIRLYGEFACLNFPHEHPFLPQRAA